MKLKAWMVVSAVLAGGLLAGTGPQAAARCDKDDAWCQALVQKTRNLKTRDPAAEARAAMAKGDFRLGQDFYYGDPIIIASSGLPGVHCRFWPSAMIGKRHTHQDYIPAGGEEHTKAAGVFLKTYNRTIVSDPRFPWPDICALEGRDWAKVYAGPVTTPAQAVRSRDLAKLKALALTPETANAEDPLRRRPLDWAILNGDIDMAAALVEAGADVSQAGDEDGSAVGLAILKGRFDLAKAWVAKGGGLPMDTGLCPTPVDSFGRPVPTDIKPPDPGYIPPVGDCGWAGLLIQHGQLDILDTLMAAAGDDYRAIARVDSGGDIGNGFRLAVLKGDMATARRLLPYAGDPKIYPGYQLGWLYHHKQYEMVKTLMLTRHMGTARSVVEADLWRAALEAGRYPAFAMLFDYGWEVNRLSAAQLAACRTAVLGGSDGEIFDACVRAAFERSEAMQTAIKAGDTPAFKALIADSASVREDNKIGLDALVAAHGTPEMFTALVQAGAKQRPGLGFEPREVGGDFTLFNPQLYDGGDKARFDGYVLPHMIIGDHAVWGNQVVSVAYARDDQAMLDAVLAANYTGLAAALNDKIGVGSSLRKYIPDFISTFDKQIDAETYPVRPADPALMARLQRDIPRVARVEGPQALEPLFTYAAQLGWNDVTQLILDDGFDARQIKNSGDFWFHFALWDSTCKPSMAHLLIKAGIPVGYSREGEAGDARLLNDLAATWRDGATIGVAIREGGFDVNEPLDESGATAFDEASRRGYDDTVRTLTALGGKPGKLAHPDMRQASENALAREGFDADLWQGPPDQ